MQRLKSTPGAVEINRGWNQPELRLKSTAVKINRWAIAQQVEKPSVDFNRFNRTSTEGSFSSIAADISQWQSKCFKIQTSTTSARIFPKSKIGNQSHTLTTGPRKMRPANSKFRRWRFHPYHRGALVRVMPLLSIPGATSPHSPSIEPKLQ